MRSGETLCDRAHLSAAINYGPRAIRVNAICAGTVGTLAVLG